MSNGDDESADAPEDAPDEGASAADDESTALSSDTLQSRLDDVESALEDAETEADLDEVEVDLDAVESDLEAADLPEPDEDDDEDLAETLQSRIDDLRDDLEDARGPYAEDVVAALDESAGTVRDTRWTEDGEPDVRAAVEAFLEDLGDVLESDVTLAGEGLEEYVAALEEAGETVAEVDLDPDEDAEAIATLQAAADELASALDDAEEWSDLKVVEQLERRGFYDRLTGENRKDFPPELGVVRIAEAENDPERILMALEKLESDFMQENALDALERLGPAEAFDLAHERAKKRSRQEIRILGKIGDERAVDTLLEFVDSSNPPLQKVTLRALGEIGSEEATQAVADALEDDAPTVRSQAARALGLIGDTRAIDPLADRLGDGDVDDTLRAACAWALVQIGTERALEAAAEHDDDRAYTVQAEARKARDASSA